MLTSSYCVICTCHNWLVLLPAIDICADYRLQLGNFSYMVNMHADPAEAQTIPQLQACLGSTARHILQLQNPVGTEVVLQTSCSNPHNFTLSTAAVVLSPYGQAEVAVDYLPSSLGVYKNHFCLSCYHNFNISVFAWLLLTSCQGSDGYTDLLSME